MFAPKKGQRKVRIAVFYMAGLFSLAFYFGPEHWTELAAFAVGMASGVGVIVWGNVKENQAVNGGG